jgi:ubiquinone/menaquinone biosynthesis C-methylase UbiE
LCDENEEVEEIIRMKLRSFISRLLLTAATLFVVFWVLRAWALIVRDAFSTDSRLARDQDVQRTPAVEGSSKRTTFKDGVSWLPSLSRRDDSGEAEWMDLPGIDPNELTDMFQDLRVVNHWLGGWSMTARGLRSLLGDHDPSGNLMVLDVASGSADIPQMMAQHADQQGHRVTSVAIDINPEVLKLARQLGDAESVQLVAADALQLPFVDDAYDVAACSFFLHHLDPDDVVVALREMSRVSRHGVVINDLVRSWPSYLGALTFSRVFTRNRISRHDAPLSARRAYTHAELVDLAAQAGLEPVAAHSFLGYRLTLVVTEAKTLDTAVPFPASERLTTRSGSERELAKPSIVPDDLQD